MRTHAKLITAAVALLVVAVAGCQSVPGSGGTGAQPATAPSPSPALLASGTFQFPPMGAAVVLDAVGEGSNVTGTMKMTNPHASFTVDLECALTAEDGRILIGGDTTESTYEDAPTGTRIAIVLEPGSPAQMIFDFEASDLRAPSCTEYLEEVNARTTDLLPIEGSVEFGP